MTALILVVDDLPPNVKLLEAKLQAEYYDVITASDGFQAIEQAKAHFPDIILLDVMMPGMDGFEACKELKNDPATAHIPVVMVTALSEKSDRIKGLNAGADDFLTKPIKEVQLLARVKSLVRVKQLIDELRLRDKTTADIGEVTGEDLQSLSEITDAEVLVVDDDVVQGKNIVEQLSAEDMAVTLLEDAKKGVEVAESNSFDLIIVSSQLVEADGLRLCSQLRSNDKTRHLPQLILVEEDDERALIKGLEMGVNDYLMSPMDLNELVCRARTNIRRKRYQEALKRNYESSVSMAITDNLTGLYNRHYLSAHMNNLVQRAYEKKRPLSCLIMDMDHFKEVNDTYGHDCGDEILRDLAKRIQEQTRSSDMVARYGGEEFVILLPDTGMPQMSYIAERIRHAVESVPFMISHDVRQITKTISIGGSMLHLASGDGADSGEAMIKRADEALYKAKNGGRNQVIFFEGDDVLSLAEDGSITAWNQINAENMDAVMRSEQGAEAGSAAGAGAVQSATPPVMYAPPMTPAAHGGPVAPSVEQSAHGIPVHPQHQQPAPSQPVQSTVPPPQGVQYELSDGPISPAGYGSNAASQPSQPQPPAGHVPAQQPPAQGPVSEVPPTYTAPVGGPSAAPPQASVPQPPQTAQPAQAPQPTPDVAGSFQPIPVASATPGQFQKTSLGGTANNAAAPTVPSSSPTGNGGDSVESSDLSTRPSESDDTQGGSSNLPPMV